MSFALAQTGGGEGGGIENENEAEDWGFRTVSCSGVALPMWATCTTLVPNPTDDYL